MNHPTKSLELLPSFLLFRSQRTWLLSSGLEVTGRPVLHNALLQGCRLHLAQIANFMLGLGPSADLISQSKCAQGS